MVDLFINAEVLLLLVLPLFPNKERRMFFDILLQFASSPVIN